MADREPLDIDALMAEVDASLAAKSKTVPKASKPPKAGKAITGKPAALPATRGMKAPEPASRGRVATALRMATTTAIVIGVVVYLIGLLLVGPFAALPFALGAALGAVPATLVGRLSRG